LAGRRQPLNLVLLKGKKHLTKAEIEERQKTEVKAKADKVKAPSYLPPPLRREFKKIADELLRIDLISNLDVDALARFLYAREQYLRVTDQLRSMDPTVPVTHFVTGEEIGRAENETYSALLNSQDKLFKQCRQAAADLGLTISSRCRLVVPKKDDAKKPSEEEQLFGQSL
jgi:P27 family predicted phage terminase small subunit